MNTAEETDSRVAEKLQACEARIRRIEGTSRLYLVSFWFIVACLLMGQLPQSKKLRFPLADPGAVTDTVSTHKLRLVDDQGRPRANFVINGDEVYLILGEANGKSRLALRVKDQGDASVVLAGSDGEPKATIVCGADGTVKRIP